jgi:hypothetical protein
MTILWGPGNTHDHSQVVRADPAKHPAIATERFLGDAPQTNPDDMVWPHRKHARLSNLAPDDITEPRARVAAELVRLHENPELLAAFIRHAKVVIRLIRQRRVLPT